MLAIKRTSLLLRYGVAVLAVGMAFLVKLLLDPLIVQETPFLLVFGAIMISAWYGGLGPGLLATFAAGLATDYFFPPTDQLLVGVQPGDRAASRVLPGRDTRLPADRGVARREGAG